MHICSERRAGISDSRIRSADAKLSTPRVQPGIHFITENGISKNPHYHGWCASSGRCRDGHKMTSIALKTKRQVFPYRVKRELYITPIIDLIKKSCKPSRSRSNHTAMGGISSAYHYSRLTL